MGIKNIKRKDRRLNSIRDLRLSYRKTYRMLKKAYDESQDPESILHLDDMITDCAYAIEWMQSGRRPGSKRGVEHRYVTTWDPLWIDQYYSPNGWSIQRESRDLTNEEHARIEEAMVDLSMRERQCFMMYHVDGMSYSEIALELYLSKSTIQTNIERAKEKIEHAKMTSLFLLD